MTKNIIGTIFLLLYTAHTGWAASLWDCNFEDLGFCTYMSVTSGENGWTLIQASNLSSPNSDHTPGKGGKGRFLKTSEKKIGFSKLQARKSLNNDGPVCLSFYIHQTGKWLHTFSVTAGTEVIMKRSGDNEGSFQAHNIWHHIEVEIPYPQSSKGILMFSVKKTQEGPSETAIDDIVLMEGKCEPSVGPDCTFERGACGWDNSSDASSSFALVSHSEDPQYNTSDHTLATNYGHFMLARNGKDKYVSLTSTSLAFNSCVCLRFFYILMGDLSSTLELKTRASTNLEGDVIWDENDAPRGLWNIGEVSIIKPKNLQVLFHYYAGKAKTGYIGLDDISFTLGLCPSEVSVDFESGELLPMANTILGRNFNWRVIQPSHSQDKNKPPVDVTVGTSKGHVAFASGAPAGHRARLATLFTKPVSSSCMTFNVFVSGTDPGTLNVTLQTTDLKEILVWSWTPTPNEGNTFLKKEVTHTSAVDFRTVFTVVMGTDGGWAIDDIHTHPSSTCKDDKTSLIKTTPTSMTSPMTQFEDTMYDCDFEYNTLCKWTTEESLPKAWKVIQAHSKGFRDHTINLGIGKVVTSFEYGKIGDRAQLLSPVISGGLRCLIFYLKAPQMTGVTIIVFEDFGIFTSALRQINTFDSPNWQRVELPIGLKNNISYQIVIEALMERTSIGQIVLDDIKVPSGPCPKDQLTFNDVQCNFEDGDEMCGFVQDLTGDYPWDVSSPEMKKPLDVDYIFDHTLKSLTGHFLFSKMLDGDKGSKARIISPKYEADDKNGGCLSFFYHMNGEHIGALNVYIAPDGQEQLVTPGMLKWSRQYDVGPQWQKAFVQIHMSGSYHVVFETVRSKTDYIYGIDDLKINTGKCPDKDQCSFEYGECLWNNFGSDAENNGLWTWFTPHENFGLPTPPIDHTSNSSKGHFLLYPIVDQENYSNYTRIYDMVRGPSSVTNSSCFTFWYHMYGEDVGTLRILVRDGASNSTPFSEASLWEMHGETGDDHWHLAQVPISSVYTQVTFQIIIEAVRGSVTRGNIAVDDTTFLTHACEIYPPEANPTKDVLQRLDCDFDYGSTCNWIQSKHDDTDFKITVADTDAYENVYDHTSNFPGGKILVLKGGDKKSIAALSSPVMFPTGGVSCLTFYYAHKGNRGSEITLLMRTGTKTQELWTITEERDYSRHWDLASINLHSDLDYQLILKAQAGEKQYGNVAIDDIRLYPYACRRKLLCDFEQDKCNFQDRMDSDFNWERYSPLKFAPYPLPSLAFKNVWGYYLSSLFRDQKSGAKSRIETPMYPTSKGECFSFYINYGYNKYKDVTSTQLKGIFRVFLVQKESNGERGSETLMSVIPITPNELSWTKIHFDVRAQAPYWLIFEAEVKEPSGYVVIDELNFSTSPCPSTLSCDFENSMCGYTNEDSSFLWYRKNTGLRSTRYYNDEHDHTTGSSEGHYLLYEYDQNAKAGYQEATIQSSFQPSTSTQCLVFWYAGFGTATIGVYTMPINGTETQIVQKTIIFKKISTIQDYEWDYLRMNFNSSDDFTLRIKTKTEVPNTIVAIDDIQVQTGSCEEIDERKNKKPTPYYDDSKLLLACDFDDRKNESCNYNDNNNWLTINSLILNKIGTGPFSDHTKNTIYGNYVYTASGGSHTNITTQLSGWSFSATGKVCADFYFNMVGEKNTIFNMYVGIGDKKDLYFSRQGDLGHEWLHATVDLEGKFKNYEITLEGKFGVNDVGYIAVDDFYVYNQPCPPSAMCTFEADGLCNFQQDNEDTFDWYIKQASDQSKLATKIVGPDTDHTLQTGKGHYVVFDMSRPDVIDKNAALVSPMYRVENARCLTFWYHMQKAPYAYHNLEVYLRDESGKERLLDIINGQSNRKWNIARYPIYIEQTENVQIIFNGVSKGSGGLDLDDIEVSPSLCHEAINCYFINDGLCNWQNDPSNSMNWRSDLDDEGKRKPVMLTVPTFRIQNVAEAVSILTSEPIPVGADIRYCVELKYDILGRVIHTLEILFMDATGTEHSQQKISNSQDDLLGILYIPADTTLHATKVMILIKVVYGNEREAGSVSLYYVKVHGSECSQVQEAAIEGFQCTENSKKLPNAKVCDFVNDCQTTNSSDEDNCGNCTFENNYCGWIDDSDGSSSFSITKNLSISGNINSHNHYIALGSGFKDQNSYGDLVFSKLMGPSPSGCIMTFEYFTENFDRGLNSDIQYPVDYGVLTVVMEVDEQKTVIWRSPHGRSQEWHTAYVDIGHIRNRFKIHFQAEHYSYIQNVIAIDSIAVDSCHFPENNTSCTDDQFQCKSGGCISIENFCDLEINCQDGSDEDSDSCAMFTKEDFEHGFGYWQQEDTRDNFDWVRHEGASINLKNGPRRDHTLGTNRGHYLLMEGRGHKRGDIARLIGPTMKPVFDSCKMRLFMHRLGDVSDGDLSIYIRTTKEGPMTTVAKLHPLEFDWWNKKEFVLTSSDNFQVVLEGKVGSYHTADIGIDDISFTPSCVITDSESLPDGIKPNEKLSECQKDQFQCESGNIACIDSTQICDFIPQCHDGSDEQNCGSCSFDQDSCGWEDVSPGHVMFQLSKATNAKGVAPTRDHTTNSSTGSYMAIVNGNGDFAFPAMLVGPHVLPKTAFSCKLEVYFYKKGPTRGKIAVGVQRPGDVYKENDKVAELAFHDFHQAEWLKLSARYGRIPAGYQPYIEITSYSAQDAIAVAIDDISFTDCEPSKIHDIDDMNCEFENGFCDWFNDNWNGERWKRTNLSTPEPNTGPDRDHTTGSGYYVYTTSPNDNTESGKPNATLTSGKLQWPDGLEHGCLSFWYHMFGVYTERLEVYVEQEQQTDIVYSKSKSQGNVWRQGFANLNGIKGTLQITFFATLSNYRSDVALDDIKFSRHDCPIMHDCDFELDLCAFYTEDQAWKITLANNDIGVPSIDHTLGTKYGSMLTFTPKKVSANQAILNSFIFTRMEEKMCLMFYYYAPSRDVNCEIYVKGDDTNLIWNATNINTGWNYAQQTFMPSMKYQIIFEGTSASKYPISFDDLRIEGGECPTLGSCDFEKNDCGYAHIIGGKMNWQRNSGAFIYKGLGPPVDHTTKTEEGFYMIADSGSDVEPSYYVPLQSPMLSPTTECCFSFWFYMHRDKNGSGYLQVKQMRTVLWEHHDVGDQWIYKALNISSSVSYKISFYVVNGKGIKSDVAIDDILITDGDCTQRNKTYLKPEVPLSYATTKFDCNFDNGTACKWTLQTVESACLDIVNRSVKGYNAQLYDHTYGNGLGQFLSFSSDGNGSITNKAISARMLSPKLDDHNISNGTCLKFWYMMQENAVGSISVTFKDGDHGHGEPIWIKYGVTESGWTFAQVYVSPVVLYDKSTDTQFIINFRTEVGAFEEFRIDDISLNDGLCAENLEHCDFQDPSICGFIQDNTDYLDWVWVQFPTNVLVMDHSYGTGYGHYMSVSRNDNETDVQVRGRLLSPVHQALDGKCLQFFYFMNGDFEHELHIKTVSQDENENLIWEKSGDTGPRWRGGQVDINTETPSRLIFEGIVGESKTGYIAIDDISLLNKSCPDPGTCNFEDDMCLFHNVKGTDNFDWLRHSGPTTAEKTGPVVDATTHTKDGHYLYIESSPPRNNGDKAQLESELLLPTAGSCLTFSYHMFGNGIGQLNLFMDIQNQNIAEPLLSISGNMGNNWKQKSVTISSPLYSFSIIFEAVIGTIAYSDIAIDDIKYMSHPCDQTENVTFTCNDGLRIPLHNKCDFVAQCLDHSDEMDCGSCTFEKNLCGYVSFGIGEYRFRRSKGLVSENNLGIDHTLGTKSGHMVYIEGVPYNKSKSVTLKSPLLQKSYQTCQVKFYYKLMNYSSSIQVALEFESQEGSIPILILSETYNLGSWIGAMAQIGHVAEPFYITFKAEKQTHNIPFAIDDVTFEGCNPPAPVKYKSDDMFTCQSGYQVRKNVVCDLSDDCGDGSDEMHCQNVTACTFERSLCTWNVVNGMAGNWTRSAGFSTHSLSGPLRDHTTGTPSGFFIYLQHDYEGKFTATLISQVIAGVKENEHCQLTVYYQMRSLTVGALLNIYIQTATNGYKRTIFTKHNQHQNYWDRVILSLKSSSDFQVIIEGVGKNYTSSQIGLDDLVFSSDCHLSGFYATLPTPTAPITTQKNIINTCPYQNQYQCADDTCIDSKRVCDFNKDCKDDSDEQNCGTCDFEKGWCGWYQSSTGHLQFSLSSSQDATNNHYIYVAPSSGISDTPVVIESGPLPPVSSHCQMTFRVTVPTRSKLTSLDVIAVNKESSILVYSKKLFKFEEAWQNVGSIRFKDVYKELNDGWHLKLSWNFPANITLPRDGLFALDEIEFSYCSLNNHGLLSCAFWFDNFCDWKQTDKDIFDWEIGNKSDTDVQPHWPHWDGKFAIARSQGQRQNDGAVLMSRSMPPITESSGCLGFWYFIPGNTGTLSINMISGGGRSGIFFSQNPSEVNEWTKVYLSLMSDYRFTIEIVAVVSGHSGDDIMIDEIEFLSYPCEDTNYYYNQCTFDDRDMCTWTQGIASQIDWSVKNSINTSGMSIPATDHTTRSKYGYYAYVETNQDDKGDQAILTRSIAPSKDIPFCFTFWFHMAGNTSSLIRVSVNTNSTNELQVTYPGPTNNMWRRGAIEINLRATEIVLTCILNGGFGHIAIDDTKLYGGNCFGPGTCDFRHNLCGYVNDPSNMFDFVIKKQKISNGTEYAIAFAQPLSDTEEGDAAALISEPIFKGGCLKFYRYLKSSKSVGLVSRSLSVYTRQLISPQKRTLVKTMNYFVRNEYMPPIYIDISDKTNFEIIFEVIYSSESIGIYNVLLDNYPCSFTTTVSPVTTVPPSIPPIHPPSPLDCQFEDNFCSWTKVIDNEYHDWLLAENYWGKPRDLEDFFIQFDHSNHTTHGGFIKAKYFDERFAYLLSPKVSMNGSMCFQFWYFMFGSNVGTLKVVLNTKTILWTKTGTLAPKWHFAAIHITGVDEGVISLEASGSRFDSEIGIDDISAFFGKCPENNRCDFENGDCGYELKAPWKLVSEIPMMGMVYPLSGDHTEGTPRGHCLAMDAKSGRFTTTIFSVTEGSCLTFWYHMDGYDKASLVVSKLNTDSTMDNSEIVFSVSGSQGPTWQLGTIDISESTQFVLIFEGSLEGKLLSDTGISIVIDDIKLVDGKCPHFGSCDFEDELCPWTNVKEVDNYDWMQFTGNLLSKVVLDHTTGTKYGGYLVTKIDRSSTAILASPTLQQNTQYCLSFWAILNDNSLTVNTTDLHGHDLSLIDKNHVGIIEKDAKPNDWKLYQFDLDRSLTQFQITIEGKSATTHLYLEDISIHNDHCSNVTSITHRHQHFYCNTSRTWYDISKKCDFAVDCPGNNEEQACGYDCDFESQACKWDGNEKGETSVQGDWVIETGNNFTSQAIADHTLDSVNGHFTHVYSLPGYSPNIVLESPLLQMSGTRCELIFSFFILNDNKMIDWQFTIHKVQKRLRTLLGSFNINDYVHSQWESMHIPLGRSATQFYIEITSKSGLLIDDIILNNCNLPTKDDCVIDTSKQFTCDNSACVDAATVCNLQDDCGDNSDEGDDLCKNYKMNDFEDGSLGFWVQEIGTDEFDWHVYQSEEYVDHTTISSSGHVASAANYRRSKKTDRAHLISPAFGPGDKCTFTLYYKMEHGSKGSFNIYKRHEVNGDLSILQSPEPEGKFTWKQIQLVISDKKAFQIVLEINAKFQSTIDIDDTVFDQGCILFKGEFPVLPPKLRPTPMDECPKGQIKCDYKTCISTNERCDSCKDCSDGWDENFCKSYSMCQFNFAYCNFFHDTTSSIKWITRNAFSTFKELSPGRDHTEYIKNSFYLEIGPALKQTDLYGRIKSSVIIQKKIKSDCQMRFFYYQKGNVSGTLNIYSQFEEDGPLKLEWSNQHGTYGKWDKASITFSYRRPFRVVIEGVAKIKTVIAIDDISFTPSCYLFHQQNPITLPMPSPFRKQGSCQFHYFQCDDNHCLPNRYFCDMTPQCDDGTDEMFCDIPCDFENGTCGWISQSATVAVEKYEGVDKDHNPGNNKGHVLPTTTSGGTMFKSLFYESSLKDCTFTYWYKLLTDTTKEPNMRVYYEKPNRSQLKLLDYAMSPTDRKWTKAFVKLPTCASHFQLVIWFKNMVDVDYPRLLLDDFNFEDCAANKYVTGCGLDEFMCQDRLSCIPNSMKCDLSIDCCDGSDEDAYLCYSYRQFTFDDNLEYDEWEQRMDDEGDWSFAFPSKDAPYDHTASDSRSYETNFVKFQTEESKYKAKMSYPMNAPFAECHVRLWYAGVVTNNETSGTLNIYMYSNQHMYTKLTSVQVSNGDWNKLDVEIKSSTTYELVLEATGGVISPSGICLDDISFTPGCNMGSPTPPPTFIPPTVPVPTDQSGTTLPLACPGKFHCKNSNECIEMSKTCDFTFDCLDQTDENNCYTIELCDFTHDNCGWTSSSTEIGLKWIRDTPSGAKQGLAPSYDASLHQGENAYFMYLSVNPGQQMKGKSVSLVSRELNEVGASCQIQFSFFLQGLGAGLSMYITSREVTDLLWLVESQNDEWQKASIGIGRRTGQFTLEIKKLFSTDYHGITAIDNIRFAHCAEAVKLKTDLCVPEETKFTCINKACIDKIHMCDGQDDCGDSSDEGIQLCDSYDFIDFEGGFNSMTQTPTGVQDSLDWKIWAFGQNAATGLQEFDHSTFSSNGHYAYVQSIKSGDSAWLLSSNWVVTGNGGYCRGSVYVMAPEDSSKISIGYRTHNKGDPDQQISTIQSTGSVWTQVSFNITLTKPFQLVFQAQFSAAGAAIAMDDFVMYDDQSSTCNIYPKPLPNLSCPTTKFECHSDSVCIDPNNKCDGKNDCNDGSDESICVKSTQSAKATTDKSATVTTHAHSTIDYRQTEKSVSPANDDSWKTPVGVTLGLVAFIAIAIVIIIFLKRKDHLKWLTLPRWRSGLPARKENIQNPLFNYGTGESSDLSPAFQMEGFSPRDPDDVFGMSTNTSNSNDAFENPLYIENEGESRS